MSTEAAREKRKGIAPTEEAHEALTRDHPLEEAQKSYHTVLEQQIEQAEEELERPAMALLLSGLAAGLELGFGPFAMAVQSTLTKDVFPGRCRSCSTRASTNTRPSTAVGAWPTRPTSSRCPRARARPAACRT